MHEFFQDQKHPPVNGLVANNSQGHIVAAQFPLITDPVREPPDGRVIKQERLDHQLHCVDNPVVPTGGGGGNMRKFVCEEEFN